MKKLMSFTWKEQTNQWHTSVVASLLLSLSILSLLKAYDCLHINVNLSAAAKTYMEKTISESKMYSTSQSENYCQIDQQKERGSVVCDFSNRRFDICEIAGCVIIPKNTTTIYISDSNFNSSRGEVKIKPHPRKGDPSSMDAVSELSLKPLTASHEKVPHCTRYHTVPALIFSAGGYAGNIFHAFSDVLIPLFISSHQFHGDVRFFVSDYKPWWFKKYRVILKGLSRYKIIDMNQIEDTHCFRRVIVGMPYHKELSVDPSKSPQGYSIMDFIEVLRKSLQLGRESKIQVGALQMGQRPRLMLISRPRTRKFVNKKEIVEMAESLGFDVVVAEAVKDDDTVKFAQLVNSCDVMMGVHGAGLTNMFFLPVGAVIIQLIPFGSLEVLARFTYGGAAIDMKLKYLEYKIEMNESTLIEQYPSDHPVLRDPESFRKQGFAALKSVYLVKQDVRPNLDRLRNTLLEALNLLRS